MAKKLTPEQEKVLQQEKQYASVITGILDNIIEDAEKDWKVGDIMEFDVNYATLVYLSNCRNVQIAYV